MKVRRHSEYPQNNLKVLNSPIKLTKNQSKDKKYNLKDHNLINNSEKNG